MRALILAAALLCAPAVALSADQTAYQVKVYFDSGAHAVYGRVKVDLDKNDYTFHVQEVKINGRYNPQTGRFGFKQGSLSGRGKFNGDLTRVRGTFEDKKTGQSGYFRGTKKK